MRGAAKGVIWVAGACVALVATLQAWEYFQENWSLDAKIERACLAKLMRTQPPKSEVLETRSFQVNDDSAATLAHYSSLIEIGQSRAETIKARIAETERGAIKPSENPKPPSEENDYTGLVETMIILSSLKRDLEKEEAELSRDVASRNRIQAGRFSDYELVVLVSLPGQESDVISALCVAPKGLGSAETVDKVQLVTSG
ncbi:hypothetical protein [Pseudoxanthomonas sacheonensis]|uniref:hypothetical protein n=1 Tax=Pseudoxanthomonas sacheonensis TaxID=443615 RepID=UPI0013D79223|nr:hypothetical protein [Pseudoxanthomonas sacheonensis]KAF1710169.1 hypothetical protein CSC73_05690 [Pseudoxanthomonas sacheonensis]